MAGLYDGIDPQTALLLGLGSGLLGTVGQGRRASFGEALANGMQAGTAGYRQAVGDRQRAEQMRAEQQAQMQRQQLQQAQLDMQNKQFGMAEKEFAWKEGDRARSIQQQIAMQNELMKIDPTGKLAALYKLDPKAAAEQVFPKGIGVKDIDPRDLSFEALAALRQTGRLNPGDLAFKPKTEFVNGVAVDMSSVTPGQVAPQPVDAPIIRGQDQRPMINPLAMGLKTANDPFTVGAAGNAIPNGPVQQFLMSKAAAGGTRINMPVSVNTEKTYGGNIAEGLAKQDIATIDIAKSAPQQVATSQRVKQLVGSGAITSGTFASQRQAMNKAFATAGLIDGSKVINTEALASELASQTLDSIKTSGLGSGQGFTDKDRMFLQEAKSGSIDMTPQNIYRIADLNERTARIAIKRGQEVASRLKGDPIMGTIGQSLTFAEPPSTPPLKLPPTPNASSLLTGALYETPKGVLRWNGFKFEANQ